MMYFQCLHIFWFCMKFISHTPLMKLQVPPGPPAHNRCTRGFAPNTSNINAQFCSTFHSSSPTVSKNHCLNLLHVLLICGWASLPVCTSNISSAAFKHFDSHLLWQTVLSVLGGQLLTELCAFHSFSQQKCTTAHCLSLVQTSKAAAIFTPCSLSTNRLHLNQSRSMPPSDHEL
jgi:hypothetical protein